MVRALTLLIASASLCSSSACDASSDDAHAETDAGTVATAGGGATHAAAGTGAAGSARPSGEAGSGAVTSASGSGGGAGSAAQPVDGGREQPPRDREDSGPAGEPPQAPTASTCGASAASAPSAAWANATGNLAGLESECGNLTLVAADPCSGKVIAGVAKNGLWASADRGATWSKLGSGAGSASIVHRPSSIVFDPEHPSVIYESGIYGALDDGVFESDDGGTTWKPLGTIGHIDLVSVDFSDPARKTLLAGVHETKQKLFLSTDGGASWTDIGAKLPAGSHFSSAPLVLDAHTFLLGACGWGDGTCGVFASDDRGEHWQQTSMESPAGQPLWASDGQLVWPTIWGSGAILSDDRGQHWTKVEGPHAGSPVELPDGRIVAVGGDHLILSSDHGRTWANIGEPLPYQAAGVTYSPAARSFFIWHNDCNDAVLPDAIMTAGWTG